MGNANDSKKNNTAKGPDMVFLRMAFERDDPYTMYEGGECYFNKRTLEVIWLSEDWGDSETIEEHNKNPEWIIVPGTPHGEWHEVFQEYLREIGMIEHYTTSIGLTLRNLPEEVEQDVRNGWGSRKWEYAEKKAEEWVQEIANSDPA